MKPLYAFMILCLFLALPQVEARPRQEAALSIASVRGELFYLTVGGRVINRTATNRVDVGDLPAGKYWLDIRVLRRGRAQNIRAEVFLQEGYESIYELARGPRGNAFFLRKVGEEPMRRRPDPRPTPRPNPRPDNTYDQDDVVCRNAMQERELERALRFMKEEGMDDRKLEIAKGEIKLAGGIMTEDLMALMDALIFEDRKVKLAKYAYTFVCDTRNFPRVLDALEFSSNKREMQDFIYKQ